MTELFESIESAFLVLGDPGDPRWGAAFQFLSGHPETAVLMQETFRETLEQMGVPPSGTDPITGGPTYSMRDMAQALGVPQADLDQAIDEAGAGGGGGGQTPEG